MGFIVPLANLTPLAIITRAATVYVALVVFWRLIGRRETARLGPYGFVLAVLVGIVAAAPLTAGDIPVGAPLLSIAVLGVLWVVTSWAGQKSNFLHSWLTGEPTLLVAGGKVIPENLARTRLNLAELLSHLRRQGSPDLNDVEFALLEPDGRISVALKSHARPATPGQLHIPTRRGGLPATVIRDGHIIPQGLRKARVDRAWIENSLSEKGLKTEDVLVAIVDGAGTLYVQQRNGGRSPEDAPP